MCELKQIRESEWGELANPIQIAVLPFKPEELSQKYALEYLRYEEDGLGEVISCVIQVRDFKFWLSSCIEGPEDAKYFLVESLSFEPNNRVALEHLLNALDLTSEELRWRSSELGVANWILYRVDDNSNEIEMLRFHHEASAIHVMNKYQAKGHKQAYIVSRAT